MGVVTSAVIGGIGVGASILKGISENKKAKAYEKSINDYDRQELRNPYEDLQVSRAGSNLALQENSRNSANMVSALQSSGINGLGMLSNIQANINDLNLRIGANLDQQYINNENKKAEGEAMVMQMQERREEGDLAGLGNAMSVAQNNSNQAFGSAINGAMASAMTVAGAVENKKVIDSYGITPSAKVESLDLTPSGINLSPQGTVATIPMENNFINPSIPYAGFYDRFNKLRNRGV